MSYVKSVFFNFLVVFFANHILPGVDVVNQTKLPHIGGDLIFAIVLGVLNGSIFHLLKILGHASFMKVVAVSVVMNFVAYALIKFIPAGIQISSIQGYGMAAGLVVIGSCLTNYFEMKKAKCHASECSHEEDSMHR